METKEQRLFWQGYELGLNGRCLPIKDADDWFWQGWAHGHVEREGWLRVSKWEGRKKRFRRLLYGLKLLCTKHKTGVLRTWQGIPLN
jgi:hypothetical protein